MHSVAVYDLVADVLRGRVPATALRRRAFGAPLAIWRRVLGFEGCAVQFDHALLATGLAGQAPDPLRVMLRGETSRALRDGLLIHRQLPAIAALAAAHGIRVLALKGAARLLAGEPAGARSVGDIDLLASATDAPRLHLLLQSELGYRSEATGAAHHLPGLTRAGHIGIEIHHRLSPDPTALDARVSANARSLRVGAHAIDIPCPSAMLLHTLEHAIGVNWTGRYRLRDICDVAALWTSDVSLSEIESYVRSSPSRPAVETLLSAAHAMEPRVPRVRAGAWSTVRRVSRTRIALAVMPRTPRLAERWFRYAGLLAEGSPRAIWRAGTELVARGRAAMAAAAVALLCASCSDPSGSTTEPLPAFVFSSDAAGVRGIYLWEDEVVTRLSDEGSEDSQPHSAAGSIVFRSQRDGNGEIYIADAAFAGQVRLTTDPWDDTDPGLSPAGETVAFVSNRSGAPRIWIMDADGGNQRPLPTGSSGFVPEGAPAWRPSGERIAFTSTRTGTSQVFVMDLNGGTALQLSHEATGAFNPAWSSDGRSVLYTALEGGPAVRIVPWNEGAWRTLAAGTDPIADAACSGTWCIAVAGTPGSGMRDIVSVSRVGRAPILVVEADGDDAEPAFLVR